MGGKKNGEEVKHGRGKSLRWADSGPPRAPRCGEGIASQLLAIVGWNDKRRTS